MILSAGCRVFQGWGRSSAGRAPALQAGGHRFDPDRLHHSDVCFANGEAVGITLSHGGSRFARNDESRSPDGRGCELSLVCIADVRVRFDHVPGQSVLGCMVMPHAFGFDPRVLPGWVALFFVTVNQVLVRLWARAIGISPSGLVEVPSFG